jgi:hypothetical protein
MFRSLALKSQTNRKFQTAWNGSYPPTLKRRGSSCDAPHDPSPRVSYPGVARAECGEGGASCCGDERKRGFSRGYSSPTGAPTVATDPQGSISTVDKRNGSTSSFRGAFELFCRPSASARRRRAARPDRRTRAVRGERSCSPEGDPAYRRSSCGTSSARAGALYAGRSADRLGARGCGAGGGNDRRQLAGLGIATSYDCRTRNSVIGAKLSEHATGNAIDLYELTLTNRKSLVLTEMSVDNGLRTELVRSACHRFTTVLGPGSDAYHENHIHLDLLQRRGGYRICQWEVR